MFCDTHSHLNFKDYDNDLESVIERATTAGVNRMLVVGSDLRNSQKAANMAHKNNHLFATIGIHPIHIRGCWGISKKDGLPPSLWVDDFESKNPEGVTISLNEIKTLLQNPRVVALGEIGLDYYQSENRKKINRDIQKEALKGLVELGIAQDIPLIFHCREAIEDLFDLLKPYKGKMKGVIHCFQGDTVDAKRVFDLNLLISFTGMITFMSDYDEVIRYSAIEKIMIETDCPFLAPEPHRGERNEPSYVVEVARRISEIKNLPLYKVAEETTKNAIELFSLE